MEILKRGYSEKKEKLQEQIRDSVLDKVLSFVYNIPFAVIVVLVLKFEDSFVMKLFFVVWWARALGCSTKRAVNGANRKLCGVL